MPAARPGRVCMDFKAYNQTTGFGEFIADIRLIFNTLREFCAPVICLKTTKITIYAN